MNVSQLHERLRLELLRRIERGTLTAALLARRTGLQPPHISNFLHNKRRLSIPALDRVLAALEISVVDLLPSPPSAPSPPSNGIPLISQDAAMHEEQIRPSPSQDRVLIPQSVLAGWRLEHASRRPARDRFVAITLVAEQAQPMEPLLQPRSIVILDRHSTTPTTGGASTRHIYAVRFHGALAIAYVTFQQNFLILRPHAPEYPFHLLAVPPQVSPADLIVGRVCAVIHTL